VDHFAAFQVGQEPMEINHKFSDKAREDIELVERFKKHKDQSALEELMKRYRDSIYYMVLKMVNNHEDAEDLTVEAFTKAFMNMDKYVPNYAFSTWLFRIASNNVIDFLRKKRIDTVSIHDDSEESGHDGMIQRISSDLPNPEDIFVKSQRAKILRDVIQTINPKYAELIELRYFRELSYEEIAGELDMPIGTVKVQLHRAKKMIHSLLKNSPLRE
jgi:RNA polymerase sigma-70 factor (ECF subfamily)